MNFKINEKKKLNFDISSEFNLFIIGIAFLSFHFLYFKFKYLLEIKK